MLVSRILFFCIDFIEGLPKSYGREVKFVVGDRLGKYAHFMALAHPYSAGKCL